MPPKEQLLETQMDLFLNNTAGHHVYILCLDQIGHHVVLETRAGMARLFQSFVKTRAMERPDPIGFSAREWVKGVPDPGELPLCAGMLEARTRWNVPHNLDRRALSELLNLIFRMQDYARQIADKMMMQLPPNVQKQQDIHQAKIHEARARGESEHSAGGAMAFAKELNDNPLYVSSIDSQGAQLIVGSPLWHGEPFCFEVPAELAVPLGRAYMELSGHSLQGAAWMKLLLFKDWQTQASLHDLTGQPQAIGWSFVAATIPH